METGDLSVRWIEDPGGRRGWTVIYKMEKKEKERRRREARDALAWMLSRHYVRRIQDTWPSTSEPDGGSGAHGHGVWHEKRERESLAFYSY